ncbi:DUF2442 domain-containing protein [Roseospira navarrensis]|uniref:DUF2442 domain-containing protein n=1 Tax=Roseospira navarrensis TaxID=140058 RepID=A0A7X2D3Y5_9PROT|nr:DUF2442 domain-containing protein [Roseospira navarrensis]MQX37296.1 DUF2442 domain-containing protein [Roseospira navarrensis]
MSPDAIHVIALPGYWLAVTFVTGERRLFDMKPYLGFPAFEALQDEDLFRAVRIVHGVVTWTDEIDLSPDTLYLKSAPSEDTRRDTA